MDIDAGADGPVPRDGGHHGQVHLEDGGEGKEEGWGRPTGIKENKCILSNPCVKGIFPKQTGGVILGNNCSVINGGKKAPKI